MRNFVIMEKRQKDSQPEPMKWERLISSIRLGMEAYHNPEKQTRSDFQRDFDRTVFSSPFRRLQNKTQVFPLPGHIFVHNRLTHSLEVSSVGRSMANQVADELRRVHGASLPPQLSDIGDIVATSCLCHDLGNPPFGHSGEKTISSFFSEGDGLSLRRHLSEVEWSDMVNFEGNANSFRLLTHQFVGRRAGGFAMTYSSLASIVKYPYSSLHAGKKGKFGFFNSEEPTYRRVAGHLGIIEKEPGVFARHPLTFIMEAADDICYQIMDLEDAHKLKILSLGEVKDLLFGFFPGDKKSHMEESMKRLHDPNEQVAYMRSKVIGALVDSCAAAFVGHEPEILRGEIDCSLIELGGGLTAQAYEACSATAWEKIYRSPEVVDIEIAGNRILTSLLRAFVDAVLSPTKTSSRLLLEKVPGQYDIQAPTLYGRLQGVLDHISGMTDVYALDLFRRLNGHTLPAV